MIGIKSQNISKISNIIQYIGVAIMITKIRIDHSLSLSNSSMILA